MTLISRPAQPPNVIVLDALDPHVGDNDPIDMAAEFARYREWPPYTCISSIS